MTTSRNDSFRIQLFQLGDALLVFVAFWLGAETRDWIRHLMDLTVVNEGLTPSIFWVLYIAVPLTPLVLERFGFYTRLRQKTTARAIVQLLQGLATIALILGLIALFTKQLDASRLIVGVGLVFVFFLLLARDRVTVTWRRRWLRDHEHKERVILAGAGDEMEMLKSELDAEIVAGWNIIDMFDLKTRSVEELYDLLKDESVGRVIFAANATEFGIIARAVEACELQGVEAWIAATFIRTQIARPVFDAVGDRPMLVLRSTPELSWELMLKEVIDRLGAAAIILGTLPLWVVAAVGIRIASPGAPVFFCQKRAGRYGMPFRMWKFRTMVPNAEAQLDKIKQERGNQMDGPVFKLDDDPRVFGFGKWLRKTSIDELPQLLNVVMGDMSLVGPRPLPLYEVAEFSELSHRRRLSVKPGITCEWQAGGRNQITSFEEWVEMDLRYIDNWSLWLDFKIMLRTVPAVLFGRGAK